MSGIISKGLKESFLLTNHGDIKKGQGIAPQKLEKGFLVTTPCPFLN